MVQITTARPASRNAEVSPPPSYSSSLRRWEETSIMPARDLRRVSDLAQYYEWLCAENQSLREKAEKSDELDLDSFSDTEIVANAFEVWVGYPGQSSELITIYEAIERKSAVIENPEYFSDIEPLLQSLHNSAETIITRFCDGYVDAIAHSGLLCQRVCSHIRYLDERERAAKAATKIPRFRPWWNWLKAWPYSLHERELRLGRKLANQETGLSNREWLPIDRSYAAASRLEHTIHKAFLRHEMPEDDKAEDDVPDADPASSSPSKKLEFGPDCFIYRGHKEPLPGMPWEVLQFIAESRGQFVTKRALKEKFWLDVIDRDLPDDNDINVRNCICRIRKALCHAMKEAGVSPLGDPLQNFAKNTDRSGYRLALP
jgi:hypothetical protein